MAIPLDRQYIESEGQGSKKLVLHPDHKKEFDFILYHSPPLDGVNKAVFEEWQERVRFIVDDLHKLLQLPHDEFWCQVVFDETLHQCLDSYMRHAPRSYDLLHNVPPEAKELHDELHRLVFFTCVRMSTYKESPEHFITPHIFGEILYENFIFDIPKLMDLCVLYGDGNSVLLSKMIKNIFTQQPQYEDDLRAVVPTILQVLDTIGEKCGVKKDSGSMSPQKLTDGSKTNMALLNMTIAEFQDIVFYLADTSATLWAFLDVYPESAKAFTVENFALRLASMYDDLVCNITEALRKRTWEDQELRTALRKCLYSAQANLIQSFRQIVFQNYLRPVVETSSSEELEGPVEDYLQIMTSLLTEKRFLAHLDGRFPFSEDVDLISQAAYTVDETRLQFIQDGIVEACSVFRKKKKKAVEAVSSSSTEDPLLVAESSDQTNSQYQYDQPDEDLGAGACAPRVSGIKLDSLISSVKDLLPDLGEGFIEMCLEEFNYEIEPVINAVLEDKLPSSLQDLDRQLQRQKPAVEEKETSSLLESRKNIYDNDEFDVFHKDTVDMSKIHIGKKDKTSKAVMDDKTSLERHRELYSRYGSEDVTSMYDVAEYDDEYDDTYDTNEVGAGDADSADELTTQRRFNMPNMFGKGGGGPQDVEEEEEEQEEETPPRDQFIEDPSKIRERQAQRAASRQQRYAGNRKGHHQGQGQDQGQGQKKYDVKGNVKGQGQSSEVLKNRAWKEKNKATRVHHNRKNLSDKKRQF